jgi:hypothetical protein
LATLSGENFSLTPALSRWERGNCFQFLGETMAISGARDFQLE